MELDELLSTVMPQPTVTLVLVLWHFEQKSIISIRLQAQLHMWPDCCEISSNSYENIVLTWFFWSLPDVTLTFDFLTPKSNQHIHEPKYVTKIGWS